MKFIFVILGKAKPSTRLRMLPLAARMRERGHEVVVTEVSSSLSDRLGLLRTAACHDVVVLQKKLFPAAYVALLTRSNPRLVFDLDDAVMFHELERGQPVTGKYFQRFAAVSAASRIVVSGNAFLADFARACRPGQDAGAVHELPTPIDTGCLQAKAEYAQQDGFTIGWIGTKGNLRQLQDLAAPLREVQEELPGCRLRVVADEGIDLPGVRVETKAWRAAEEQQDLHGFDVGIMPLADSLWNRGKGGYKLLQYMAAGLPAVASPVGINGEIIRHGENGYLASDADGWRDQLLLLARQPDLRSRIGRAARATIERDYSQESYLRRYVALLEGCLQ